MTDLRDKIADIIIAGRRNEVFAGQLADAILALLPQPTDDVKALIDEARQYTRLEQATVVNHDTTHALVCLCDRLATALSTAESAGYARGVEEAARVVERTVVSGPDDDEIDHDDYRDCQMAAHIRALSQEQPK